MSVDRDKWEIDFRQKLKFYQENSVCEAELSQSIWAGIAKQSTFDLHGQEKGPACSIWMDLGFWDDAWTSYSGG